MRLDHFLPFLRKRKKYETPSPPSRGLRLAKRVFPARLFSDPITGKPGWGRKALLRLGPTVISSPMRRVIQTVCFVLFLWLFLYVCWPYGARPAPPARISSGWQLADIQQNTGELRFAGQHQLDPSFKPGQRLHLVDENARVASDGYVAAYRMTDRQADQVVLVPADELAPDQFDKLLLGTGPWSLWESAPGRWPSHYADDLAAREIIPADVFLVFDPLVSLSTAVASRSWVWSLWCAATILGVCLVFPRGFCGYVCPLGTLIDLFDWFLGKRVTRMRVADDGWWVHIKYYVLLGVLISAAFGVLLSGFVAAIPVLTRGALFLIGPLQTGLMRGWHLIPPVNVGHLASFLLFVGVLGLGLLKPRFWCKYVCPTGAMFSLGNLFRVSERKVESSCIHCNKCVEICPFDAIKPDFTTRTTDCTLCQTCGGVCPTHAIKFVERWNVVQLKIEGEPPTGETAFGRRGFLSLAVGTTAGVVGGAVAAHATGSATGGSGEKSALPPVRPPGSVPEDQFLPMCIRCGQCFKVCPNDVLQAMGFELGWNSLWTPQVRADWAGCEASCNACGQVCPTGAIRALSIQEKKVARMGLAVVDQQTCLPFAGREACQLCVDECNHAGYRAIEFTRVHTQVDPQGRPIEDSGFLAPVVLPEACVGCGLCQTRCFGINVAYKQTLKGSAIVIQAGEGKEDRLTHGSYRELRQSEAASRTAQQRQTREPSDDQYFVPGAENETPDPWGERDAQETTQPKPGPPAQPSPIEDPGDPFGLGGP